MRSSKSASSDIEIELQGLRKRIAELEQSDVELKKAQKLLQQEHDKAQRYLDVASVIIVAINAKQRVDLINKTGCKLLGYTQDEIVGQNWFKKFLPPREKDRMAQIFTRLIRGEITIARQFETQTHIVTKSGEERTITWHNTLLTDENGRITGTLSSGEDITERKQVEKTLRESEARLRRITDNMTDLIAETDKHGVFKYVSPSFKSILNYDPEFLKSKPVQEIDLVHPADLNNILTEGAEIIAEDYAIRADVWQQECRLRHADGYYIWVELSTRFIRDEHNRIIATVSVGRDITDRKQMEDALRESEDRLKAIVENLGEGVGIVDEEETFVFTNPAAYSIFGVASGKLVGQNLRQFTTPEQFASMQRQTKSRRQGVKGSYETQIVRPDGEIRDLIVTATPRMKGKKFKGAYSIFRDITERKSVEKALLESEERYRRIFESAGVSIWEEDFSIVKSKLEELKEQGVTDYNKYLSEHPEFLTQIVRLIQVLDVNRSTLQMFGAKNKRELVGSLHKVFVPETLEILRDELLAIADGKTYFEGETINQTLQGEKLNIWLTMTLPSEIEKFNSVLVSMMNITARKQAEQEVILQRTRFQQLFENSPIAIALVDRQNNIQSVNVAFETIFGYQAEEIIGRGIHEVIVPNELFEEAMTMSDATLSGNIVQKETIRHRKDGTPVPVHVYGVPIILDENPVAIFAMYEDISDRKQKEQKLEFLGTHDALTGLYNRAYFEGVLARLQAEKECPVSIIVSDVDGLKKTNDTLGHAAGDQQLINTANVLKNAFRSYDVVTRLGGDEFAVILPKANHDAAIKTLNRVKERLQAFNQKNPSTPIHLSFGVATSKKGCSLAQLLQEADQLMYREKSKKKSQLLKNNSKKGD